ncbi:MAG: excinuclease ABC subunit UvrC [Microscillaceae bacterium]|nr:excinuclease ABC subunit UvrC [Microscillaceae bacterium]MDW8460459.1 excinuclease ABC subunit UvrC [Cytophagales bacterium]
MASEKIEDILKKLPHEAGVYKFFSAQGELLYVGKAKDLKNRVSSYFSHTQQQSHKTQKLVSQIADIEFTIVANEYEALLLENNLIKQHKPKYNVLLKDDKTYPYICLTNEPFPRLLVLRKVDKSKGTFFGPYTNLKAMHLLLNLIKKLYTIRSCNLALTQKNIQGKKFKRCLEYHIGNCKAPCEALQTEADYNKDIAQVRHILKGNLQTAFNYFKTQMQEAARKLEFEQAHVWKKKLELLENFQAKSVVVNPKITNLEVFAIHAEEERAFITFFRVKNGAIIRTQNLEFRKKLQETDAEILQYAILHIHGQEEDNEINEILTSIEVASPLKNVECHVPKIGDKKQLLELALKNVLFFKKERLASEAKNTPQKPTEAVEALQKALRLATPPLTIECFDNSNIQGTNPVAAMVYFKNGKPLKKEYRHFNIKTVEGPNDFASMYEIVSRRYKRLLNENLPLPHLIIVDGGKGQLNAACQALKELDLYGKIPIIGIAKRLEEIYTPEDELPLHIHKKSLALKLIQQIRDEAHRFAIEFHRLKRSKNSLKTILEEIEGIGEATIQKLLTQFKTIKAIQKATQEQLAEVVGDAKATILKQFFEQTQTAS